MLPVLIIDTNAMAQSETAGDKSKMTHPKVAFPAPYRVHVLIPLEDGTVPDCDCGRQHMVYGQKYKYCTCGLSTKQPFCDDISHEGTPYEPIEFDCDKKQKYYLLCGCKKTSKPPHCDGAHIHLCAKDFEW